MELELELRHGKVIEIGIEDKILQFRNTANGAYHENASSIPTNFSRHLKINADGKNKFAFKEPN